MSQEKIGQGISRDTVEALERLSGYLSHKISNPLAYINNYIFLLKGSCREPKQQELLGKIEQGVDQINSLLKTLVDCVAPSIANPEKTELNDILNNTIIAFHKMNQDYAGKITFEHAHEVYATIDHNRLKGIIHALLANAVQAGAQNIIVILTRDNLYAHVRIHDDGEGVAPELEGRIFEPFISGRPGSMGLGLYIASSFAHTMGGDVRITPSDMNGFVTAAHLTIHAST